MLNKITFFCLLTISLSANAQKLLVYKDACENNLTGWLIKSATAKDSIAYYLENGAYVIDNKYYKGSGLRWVQKPFGANQTAFTSIQADMSLLSGEDNYGYGLIYMAKDGSNYIYFNITATGYYTIGAVKEGKTNGAPGTWAQSGLIKKGLNTANKLKVEQRGETHSFYINDILIKKVDFPSQPFIGNFALGVRGNMRCSIDNIEVYQWLPEADLPGKVGPGFISTLSMPVAAKAYPTKTGKPQEYYIQGANTKYKYGLRDKDGYRLLDPIFNYILSSEIDGTICIDKEDGGLSRGIFTPQLQPITPMILSNTSYSYNFTKDGYMSCKMPNGLWGLIDKTGNTILPFIYGQLDEVSEGVIFAKKGGLWGAIDLKGEEVLKFGLIDDAGDETLFIRDKKAFRNGLVIARAKAADGGWDGLMNKKGEWVVQPKYAAIHYKEEAKVYITENPDPDNDTRYLFGLIDETGKQLPLPTYNAMYVYGQNYVVGKGDCDDFGFGITSGKPLTPCKWGLIDKTGKVIIPINFKNVFSTRNKEIFQVELLEKVEGASSSKTKIGFYNAKGKEIIPVQYDYIAYDSTRKTWFKDQSRWYATTVSDEGIINVAKDGKFGAIDITGKVVVPLQYDFVSSFLNGVAFVKKGNETFYIDKTGKKVATPSNNANAYGPYTELPPIRK